MLKELITAAPPVGSGVFDLVDGLVDDTRTTITGVVVVVGIIVGIVFGIKGRGVGGTIMGMAVGALICALPFVIPALGGSVEQEIGGAGANADTAITSAEAPGH